jgi:ElaB/YqjD/DUF883 family membrane-anchored ribosome-binding protein
MEVVVMADSTSEARQTSDQLMEDVRALRSHFEDFLTATRAWSGEGGGAVREKVVRGFHDARDQLFAAGNQAMDRGRHMVSATDGYVRDNPWQAVAVALLTGVLLGVMSTSARR